VEAVSALRRDVAWKVACGLRLDDEGFHPTVLVYWRNRIRTSLRPRRVFEAVRQVVEATGVLKGRGRLVTACALNAANLPDGPTGLELLAGEEPGLEVLGDSGYGSGQTRAALRHRQAWPHDPPPPARG
jgi:Transposase domain (DUF772)